MTALVPCAICGTLTAPVAGQALAICSWSCATRLLPTATEAACPHCGQVRRVVLDGQSTRCYGCWPAWVPEPMPVVA